MLRPHPAGIFAPILRCGCLYKSGCSSPDVSQGSKIASFASLFLSACQAALACSPCREAQRRAAVPAATGTEQWLVTDTSHPAVGLADRYLNPIAGSASDETGRSVFFRLAIFPSHIHQRDARSAVVGDLRQPLLTAGLMQRLCCCLRRRHRHKFILACRLMPVRRCRVPTSAFVHASFHRGLRRFARLYVALWL